MQEAAALREQLARAHREQAQLRYELGRLRDRRPVRAALALGQLRRTGTGAAVDALRGRLPRMDVPGPSEVPARPPYPHLRVVATGDGALVAGAAAVVTVTPATAAAVVRRDRPDLLLVDRVDGYDAVALGQLATAVRASGGQVVTVGRDAARALPDADLAVAVTALPGAAVPGAALPGAAVRGGPGDASLHPAADEELALLLPGAVDVRRWSPTGLDETVPPHRLDDLAAVDVAAARRQPVVVVAELPGPDALHRCLAAAAAGAVVVAPAHPALEAALAGLDHDTRALLLAPLDDRAEVVGSPTGGGTRGAGTHGGPRAVRAAQAELDRRAARLLADDELRRRVSVRLRRVVHRDVSTWAAVARIVTALGREPAPDQRISVLLATRRPERLHQVVADLAAQRHRELELILLPHGDAPLPGGLRGVARVQRVAAERPLGAVLNAGLELATGAYVAKVDDDDRYGPDHLGDQLLALRSSGAAVVGRRIHAVFHEEAAATLHPPVGGEERYEDHLPGGTLVTPIEVLRRVRWRSVPSAVDTELIRAVHLDGGSAYTAHRYGYARVRHGDHTWAGADGWVGAARSGFDPTCLEA